MLIVSGELRIRTLISFGFHLPPTCEPSVHHLCYTDPCSLGVSSTNIIRYPDKDAFERRQTELLRKVRENSNQNAMIESFDQGIKVSQWHRHDSISFSHRLTPPPPSSLFFFLIFILLLFFFIFFFIFFFLYLCRVCEAAPILATCSPVFFVTRCCQTREHIDLFCTVCGFHDSWLTFSSVPGHATRSYKNMHARKDNLLFRVLPVGVLHGISNVFAPISCCLEVAHQLQRYQRKGVTTRTTARHLRPNGREQIQRAPVPSDWTIWSC